VNVTSITEPVRNARDLVLLTCRAEVMGMTRRLATEHRGSGIKLWCVCPTAIDWRDRSPRRPRLDVPTATAAAVAGLVRPDCTQPPGAALVVGAR
jgi:NAD(P)-dependent dehydrogenase (short-subunit alcohol dehydrogenase family)